MKKSFAVIGLGRFGRNVARDLARMGQEVLAIDKSEELVRLVQDDVTQAVQADTTDERVLQQLEIREYDAVIVAIGDDIRASVLTTLLCKEQGVRRLIAKAFDDMHQKILEKTGADQVIQPEKEAGLRLARSLAQDNLLNYLELSGDTSLREVNVPARWIDKTLKELRLRNEYKISVLALRRGGSLIVPPEPDDPLQAGDVLLLLGQNDRLDRISR